MSFIYPYTWQNCTINHLDFPMIHIASQRSFVEKPRAIGSYLLIRYDNGQLVLLLLSPALSLRNFCAILWFAFLLLFPLVLFFHSTTCLLLFARISEKGITRSWKIFPFICDRRSAEINMWSRGLWTTFLRMRWMLLKGLTLKLI